MDPNILNIRNLSVRYVDGDRRVYAAEGVSLEVRRGAILALVGESGCGKSTVALAALGLLPDAGRVVSGEVELDGHDLLALPGEELRHIRGRQISMIFQDPVAGLNPVLTIGRQVEEVITNHTAVSRREARRLVLTALDRVGLRDAERLADQYPYQLSGGMCQRVLIAIATVLDPQVIIAGEPTSALDVTVQAGILNELDRLRHERGTAILLITHDLGVVAQMADQVAVMYAGRIVEDGPTRDVLRRPLHPYTSALLGTVPRPDRTRRPLQAIAGAPPDLREMPDECAFLPRCRKAVLTCRTNPSPRLVELAPRQRAACYNPVYHPVE